MTKKDPGDTKHRTDVRIVNRRNRLPVPDSSMAGYGKPALMAGVADTSFPTKFSETSEQDPVTTTGGRHPQRYGTGTFQNMDKTAHVERQSRPASVETDLLTVSEAAAHLRVSKSYIDKLRCYGGGPEYVRLGVRKILYRRSDLENWARARRYDMTSQYSRGK